VNSVFAVRLEGDRLFRIGLINQDRQTQSAFAEQKFRHFPFKSKAA